MCAWEIESHMDCGGEGMGWLRKSSSEGIE